MTMPEIGQRIRSMRGMLGLSRAQFCRRIGITPASLRNYEDGSASPNAAALVKICQEFDLNVQWLLLGAKPMFAVDAAPAPPITLQEQTATEEAPARSEEGDTRLAPGPAEVRILDELCKAMELVRDLSGRNALLAEKVNELQGKVHSLELENVRLRASRAQALGDSGGRRKKNGHVDRMPLVAPSSRLQEPGLK